MNKLKESNLFEKSVSGKIKDVMSIWNCPNCGQYDVNFNATIFWCSNCGFEMKKMTYYNKSWRDEELKELRTTLIANLFISLDNCELDDGPTIQDVVDKSFKEVFENEN